jgi:NAD(P)-dependent dehydrogenase (short-subunit alcohol dehydrogenase family)
MDDLTGTRGVVTGGASGIGFALATALLERGAAGVVLADIEQEALDTAVARLRELGLGEAHGVRCDVTDRSSVDELAEASWAVLGGVEVVCLNAGVFAGGHTWETTLDDWDWVLGVNLRGMVHGIRAFVPRLIESVQPSLVLGTASVAGIVAAPAAAPYTTSKFAAVGLMESLEHDLRFVGATHVSAAVLCPGMVSTNIDTGDRNRPAELAEATSTAASAMATDAMADVLRTSAIAPLVGARHALDQVLDGRFYVTTHEGDLWDRLVGNQNDDRLAGRPPRFQMFE